MNLRYDIPKEWSFRPDGDILYCVPFDINFNGAFTRNSFVAVTENNLYVLQNDEVLRQYDIARISAAFCESQENSGVFGIKYNDIDTFVCRFSMEHYFRFDNVVKAINQIINGDLEPIENDEPEKYCEHCHRRMPSSNYCPFCDGKSKIIKRLAMLAKPHAWYLVLLAVIMILTSVVSIVNASVKRELIDNVLVPVDGHDAAFVEAVPYLIGLAGLVAVSILLVVFMRIVSVKLGTKVSSKLRSDLFEKIQNLSLSYRDSRKPGELMQRVTGDTSTIQGFIVDVFSQAINMVLIFVFSLVLMLMMDVKLTIISLVFVTPVIFVSRYIRRRVWRISRVLARREDKLRSTLHDILSGIRVVKNFGNEHYEIEKFKYNNHLYTENSISNGVFSARTMPFLELIANFAPIMVLLIGGIYYLNDTGTFTIGSLTQYITYCNMLVAPIYWFAQFPTQLTHASVAISRIDEIFTVGGELKTATEPANKKIEGEVEFKNVSFGYASNQPVLNNISFKVKPGEMIGVVGSSGAGKSTLINLAMHLYDAESGTIKVDGVEVSEYDRNCFHSQIGVVLQESYLFNDTIMNNIRFSKPDATDDEVVAASKTAGTHDYICSLPDGYDTLVGEGGSRLSGGQKQRISIARAVLNDPRILILDEATSALDTESEYYIQQGLERLQKGRTTFAIAHRLSTLKNADRLIVIDNHTIAEMGTHEELMRNGSIYKNLVFAQSVMNEG